MEINLQKDTFIIPLLFLLCMTSGCYSFNLLQRGLEYERREDYRSAIASYERAAEQTSDPKDKAIAQGQLGRIYVRLGKYREARAILQEAKKYLSSEIFNYADVCYALGLSYYELGEYEWDRAAEEFKQVIEMYLQMPKVDEALIKSHFYLWVIYWQQKKYALAQAHFQKAMMRDKDYGEPFFWAIPPAPSKEEVEKKPVPVTVLPFSNYTGDESLDWLSHGISETLILKLATLDSITLIDSAQLEEILKQLGLRSSDLADPGNVLEIGKLVIAKIIFYGSYQKKSDDILTIIGRITNVETGEIERVVEESGNQRNIRDLMERISDTLLPYTDASSQYNESSTQFIRGNAYVFRGMYNESIQVFKKALQIMPNWAQVYNNLGNAYALTGDYKGAVQAILEVLKLAPDFPQAYYNLGNTYALALNYEAAISEYTQALNLKSDWPEACYNLARTYSLNHNKTAAKEWLKKAMTLNQHYISLASIDPAFGEVEFQSLIRSQ